MSELIQKNAGTIALIVAIIAMVSSLVPQIKELCASNDNDVVAWYTGSRTTCQKCINSGKDRHF